MRSSHEAMINLKGQVMTVVIVIIIHKQLGSHNLGYNVVIICSYHKATNFYVRSQHRATIISQGGVMVIVQEFITTVSSS